MPKVSNDAEKPHKLSIRKRLIKLGKGSKSKSDGGGSGTSGEHPQHDNDDVVDHDAGATSPSQKKRSHRRTVLSSPTLTSSGSLEALAAISMEQSPNWYDLSPFAPVLPALVADCLAFLLRGSFDFDVQTLDRGYLQPTSSASNSSKRDRKKSLSSKQSKKKLTGIVEESFHVSPSASSSASSLSGAASASAAPSGDLAHDLVNSGAGVPQQQNEGEDEEGETETQPSGSTTPPSSKPRAPSSGTAPSSASAAVSSATTTSSPVAEKVVVRTVRDLMKVCENHQHAMLASEGIFRLSGSVTKVAELCALYEGPRGKARLPFVQEDQQEHQQLLQADSPVSKKSKKSKKGDKSSPAFAKSPTSHLVISYPVASPRKETIRPMLLRHSSSVLVQKDRSGFYPSTPVDDVTGVLKKFLRDLPEPLCPFDLYESFMIAASYGIDKSQDYKPTSPLAVSPSASPRSPSSAATVNADPPKMNRKLVGDAVLSVCAWLPQGNLLCLVAICTLANAVTQQAAQNRMTSTSLGIIFAPTVFRRPANSASHAEMTESPAMALAMSLLIERAADLVALTDSMFQFDTASESCLRGTAIPEQWWRAPSTPAMIRSSLDRERDPLVDGLRRILLQKGVARARGFLEKCLDQLNDGDEAGIFSLHDMMMSFSLNDVVWIVDLCMRGGFHDALRILAKFGTDAKEVIENALQVLDKMSAARAGSARPSRPRSNSLGDVERPPIIATTGSAVFTRDRSYTIDPTHDLTAFLSEGRPQLPPDDVESSEMDSDAPELPSEDESSTIDMTPSRSPALETSSPAGSPRLDRKDPRYRARRLSSEVDIAMQSSSDSLQYAQRLRVLLARSSSNLANPDQVSETPEQTQPATDQQKEASVGVNVAATITAPVEPAGKGPEPTTEKGVEPAVADGDLKNPDESLAEFEARKQEREARRKVREVEEATQAEERARKREERKQRLAEVSSPKVERITEATAADIQSPTPARKTEAAPVASSKPATISPASSGVADRPASFMDSPAAKAIAATLFIILTIVLWELILRPHVAGHIAGFEPSPTLTPGSKPLGPPKGGAANEL